MAASAGPVPPISGWAPWLDPLVTVDHPGTLAGHSPCRGARGEEVGAQPREHRGQQVVRRHVDQRGSLNVAAGDDVDRHVEAAGGRHHAVGVALDRLLVECVEDGHVGLCAGGRHLVGDALERLAGAAGQKQPRPLPSEFTAMPEPRPPPAP